MAEAETASAITTPVLLLQRMKCDRVKQITMKR